MANKSNLSASSVKSSFVVLVAHYAAVVMSLVNRLRGFLADPTGQKRWEREVEMRRRSDMSRYAASYHKEREMLESDIEFGHLAFAELCISEIDRLRCEHNSRCKPGEQLIPCKKQALLDEIEAKKAESLALLEAERVALEAAEMTELAEFATRESALQPITQFESAISMGVNLVTMGELEAATIQMDRARKLRTAGNRVSPGSCDFQLVKMLDSGIAQLHKQLARQGKTNAPANVTIMPVEPTTPVVESSPQEDKKTAKREAAKRKAAQVKVAAHSKEFETAMKAGLALCERGRLNDAEAELIKARTARNAANAAFKVANAVSVDLFCEEDILQLVEAVDDLQPQVIVTVAEAAQQERNRKVQRAADATNHLLALAIESAGAGNIAGANVMKRQVDAFLRQDKAIEQLVDGCKLRALGVLLKHGAPKPQFKTSGQDKRKVRAA